MKTQLERIQELLEKVAAESAEIEDGWRKLERLDPYSPCQPLLTEISETLLPTQFQLRYGAYETIELIAGNRCLIGVVAPLPAALSEFGDLCGIELDSQDDNLISRLSLFFVAFCEDSPDLWARSCAFDLTVADENGGIPAGKLAERWPSQDSARTAPAATFVCWAKEVLSHATSWARFYEGRFMAGSDVENDMQESLMMLVSDLSGQADGSSRKPFLSIQRVPLRAALVVAAAGHDSLVAKVQTDATETLAASWRSTV